MLAAGRELVVVFILSTDCSWIHYIVASAGLKIKVDISFEVILVKAKYYGWQRPVTNRSMASKTRPDYLLQVILAKSTRLNEIVRGRVGWRRDFELPGQKTSGTRNIFALYWYSLDLLSNVTSTVPLNCQLQC